MSPVRSIALSSRWLTATSAIDELPSCAFFLDGVRLGEARMALTVLDVNAIRTLYLGRIETSLGELSVMAEIATPGDESTRISRENAAACMALDCVRYDFESGAVAWLDGSTGYWRVAMAGETIADGCSREDALRIGHAQVAA